MTPIREGTIGTQTSHPPQNPKMPINLYYLRPPPLPPISPNHGLARYWLKSEVGPGPKFGLEPGQLSRVRTNEYCGIAWISTSYHRIGGCLEMLLNIMEYRGLSCNSVD